MAGKNTILPAISCFILFSPGSTITYPFAENKGNMMIKYILKITIASALFLMSSVSTAQTITAWGDTLSDAEAGIAKQAEKAGATYKITSARVGWVTYVTATLIKQKDTPDAAPAENKKTMINQSPKDLSISGKIPPTD